jgi:hypothetical protein
VSGAFLPLPYPLRNDPKSGWPAAQHARAAADLVAFKRSMPFALLSYEFESGIALNIRYTAMHGGVSVAPTLTGTIGVGGTIWTWPTSFADAYGVVAPIHFRHAKATAHGAAPRKVTVRLFAPNVIHVRVYSSDGGFLQGAGASVKLWT